MPEYYTTAQAASYLGISQTAVSSLVRRGHFTKHEPLGPGNGYLIPAKEVHARKRRKRAGRLPKGGRPSGDDRDS